MNVEWMMFTEKLIQKAFEKVCYRRREYCCNNDIWELRFNWIRRKAEMLEELDSGGYKFDAVKEIVIDGQMYEIWVASDAVVIEALTMLLKDKYRITADCDSYHLKGRGGVKAAVNKVLNGTQEYKYFYKSDIKKYYASIEHDVLLDMLRSRIPDREVIPLLYQFLKRTRYRDGYYKSTKRGICRGSSLSPIIGALYLEELDICMKNTKCILYVRYMDDWVFMCDNRWKFRRIIKKGFRILDNLKLEIAYDKTLIGRTKNSFDFLGFNISSDGLRVSQKSVWKLAERIILKLSELTDDFNNFITQNKIGGLTYGQGCSGANSKKGDLSIPDNISKYVQRWLIWVKSVHGKKNWCTCDRIWLNSTLLDPWTATTGPAPPLLVPILFVCIAGSNADLDFTCESGIGNAS